MLVPQVPCEGEINQTIEDKRVIIEDTFDTDNTANWICAIYEPSTVEVVNNKLKVNVPLQGLPSKNIYMVKQIDFTSISKEPVSANRKYVISFDLQVTNNSVYQIGFYLRSEAQNKLISYHEITNQANTLPTEGHIELELPQQYIQENFSDFGIYIKGSKRSASLDFTIDNFKVVEDNGTRTVTIPCNNSGNSGVAYRYGFQGQEKDDELKGEGNSLNYTFRMHDPRVGRFFARDPLEKKFPMLTPYQFASNSPVGMVELEGLEGLVATGSSAPFSNDSRPIQMVLDAKDGANGAIGIQNKLHETHQVAYGMMNTYEKYEHLLQWNEKPSLGKYQVYFFAWFRDYGGLTGAEDVSVFRYGRTINGEEAGVLDYSLGAFGVFVPFVNGGQMKAVLKGFWRVGDNAIADSFFTSRGIKNFQEFYKKTLRMSPGERIAEYKAAGKRVADANGWKKNDKLTKSNNRDIYSSEDGGHYALDTQHGTFEVLDKKGKHQGEIDFEGSKTKEADNSGGHDIIIK